jgi:DNA invertase Pin-like site-specific DNA recombinase
MNKCVIIARSSKDRNDVSCESQIHEIRNEAIKRGEKIYKVLEFSGVTHVEFNDDPEFIKLLSEVKSKNRKWNKLWFYDTARVSRNRYKAQALKKIFEHHDVDVEFLKFPKTGVVPVDNMMEGIMEAFDQMHSDISRAGAIRGQSQNVRNGFRAGGRPPYGYRLKKHQIGINKDRNPIHKSTLEANPETFSYVKEFLERRGRGESRRSICKDFMERGIKSPSGGKTWYSSSGKSIEENIMLYQGHLVYNRHNERIGKKGYKGGRKWRDKSQWIIKKNNHTRCIDDDTAAKIMLQLETNKKRGTNPGPKKYLLTDVLFCSECGSRMVGNSGFYTCLNKLRNRGACSNSNIKAEFLDTNVLMYLKENLITEDFYAKYVKTIQSYYEQYKRDSLSEQTKYLKRIKEIEHQIGNLMTLFSRGKIKAALIEDQITPLQQEKEELEAKVIDISQINDVLDIKVDEYSEESIRDQLDRFEDMLIEDNAIEMRSLVRDFIPKINLGQKNDPRSRKWQRRVCIESYIRALTMIKVASPRGFEPLSPA